MSSFSIFCLLVLSGVPPSYSQNSYQTTGQLGSWGLGIVVPDGSLFANSQHLLWQDAVNVTASVRLPNLNETDNTVLGVLSIMLSDSSVLQISAGLFPGSNAWRGAGWFIRDIGMSPQKYDWVLNSTVPGLVPRSSIVLSIFKTNSTWAYRISAPGNAGTIQGVFESASFLPPKSGDQELFALESYTSNSTVLQHVDNLTLVSAQVNGVTIAGGTYYLSDWQPSRQPLFVVGGLPSPSSIGITDLRNGTFVWRYSTNWKDLNLFPVGGIFAIGFIIVAGSVGASFLLVVRRRTRHGRSVVDTKGTH